ncbi:uncharacterized protein LOC104906861 [Beta vulgaris subsp. vulgaris]|uniref:uncharacterized protein LOC104906861 n=1 Tax=Beta vulgaris subsp. vulgaris TaxID=3555 RepID=UPI002036FB5F|nr:uncharacterized protein LOC104906861 [Beta vulgaris subsp. vulgaris]
MSAYAKFWKEILFDKQNLEDEPITLPYQVSALMQRDMPKKQKDPWSFTLPVNIGDLGPKGTLTDLGASVSVMPLSIAKKLNFPLYPTQKIIQLEDYTMRVPHKELEDVPIQVGHVFVPCDFVVMDIDEDLETPLNFGTEALKKINERVVFEFSKTLKRPIIERICRGKLVESEIKYSERVAHTGDELYASLIEAPSLDMEEVK